MFDSATSFAAFKDAWLEDVNADSPSTVALGNRFANKIVAQWLEVDYDSLDVVRCDGAGDGGIDIALLVRGDAVAEHDEPEGDTWYLVHSRHGAAFARDETLMREGRKVIQALVRGQAAQPVVTRGEPIGTPTHPPVRRCENDHKLTSP